jgi:hypothetical protein
VFGSLLGYGKLRVPFEKDDRGLASRFCVNFSEKEKGKEKCRAKGDDDPEILGEMCKGE